MRDLRISLAIGGVERDRAFKHRVGVDRPLLGEFVQVRFAAEITIPSIHHIGSFCGNAFLLGLFQGWDNDP